MDAIKNRIKNNFEKNKVLFVVFSILWILVIVATLLYFQNTLGKESVGNESYDRSIIELDNSTVVEYSVSCIDECESVSLMFATYARINEGNVYITLKGNNSNHIYASESYDVNNLQDNAYLSIKLDSSVKSNNDKKILITIKSDCQKDKDIAIYYSNEKVFDDGILTVNNQIIDGSDLMIRFLTSSEKFSTFSKAVIISSIVGLTILAFTLLLFSPKPEILFALSTFIMGMIFMIIIVPMSPPDEQTHYEIVLPLSNKFLFINNGLIDDIYLKYGSMYGHYNISAGYARFMKDFGKVAKFTGNYTNLSKNIKDIYLLQYIPITIGVSIARAFNLNMITTIYCGRLFSLIFYTLCVYFAIKKAPSFKYLLGMIACLPMVIQTSISISYDSFINGLSLLTIASYMKWMFVDEKITIKEYIYTFVICFLLAPAKVVYGFLSFLFLLVPNNRFKNKRVKYISVIILCVPALYQLFDIMYSPLKHMIRQLIVANNRNHIIYADDGLQTSNVLVLSEEKKDYSYSFIVEHPIETLSMFYRTIRYRIKFWFYGSLGRELSGGTLILPLRIVQILTGLTFASAFVKQEYAFSIPQKISHLLICIIIGLYIMVGMFVSWTGVYEQNFIEDYGGYIVEGIQGRYFCPILPYFFTIFANKKIRFKEEFNKYFYLTYILLFFIIVVYVLSYTFVN